jgi:hypothetical protein
MPVEVSVKVDFLPFGTFRSQVMPAAQQDDEFKRLKELEEKLSWPYSLPEQTGALRGPVSIWSTSG